MFIYTHIHIQKPMSMHTLGIMRMHVCIGVEVRMHA